VLAIERPFWSCDTVARSKGEDVSTPEKTIVAAQTPPPFPVSHVITKVGLESPPAAIFHQTD